MILTAVLTNSHTSTKPTQHSARTQLALSAICILAVWRKASVKASSASQAGHTSTMQRIYTAMTRTALPHLMSFAAPRKVCVIPLRAQAGRNINLAPRTCHVKDGRVWTLTHRHAARLAQNVASNGIQNMGVVRCQDINVQSIRA